jgi:hypothetical protein
MAHQTWWQRLRPWFPAPLVGLGGEAGDSSAAQTAASPRERTSSDVSFPGSSRVEVCLPWFGDDWLEATHGEAATGMFAVAL